MQPPKRILPVIVISQFAGTSLWFAGNAILEDLQIAWDLSPQLLGWMTSSVQLGFISGTLCFAYFVISDRFSPRHIFFLSSLLGAVSNVSIIFLDGQVMALMAMRFATGFFLGGIYPVGMKIASGWYKGGLGKALGFLVGALVLGTAFPHLIKSLGAAFHWPSILISVSIIAAVGGILMLLLVPNGPYLQSATSKRSVPLLQLFASRPFRSAAFGYFGHMWELYTLWTFVPFILVYYQQLHTTSVLDSSFWSFMIIGIGAVASVAGGLRSLKIGSEKVAFRMLLGSGICILASPLAFYLPLPLFLLFMLIWGYLVIGDSPQFSTLTAKTAPPDLVGSGLTVVNSIGFAITIPSIQLCNYLVESIDPKFVFLVLLPGPVFGLIAMRYLINRQKGA